MQAKQLWSWLVRSDAKTEVYIPPDIGIVVTNQEFAEALNKQAEANNLPVKIQLQDVEWDASGTQQTRVVIRHADPRMDIMQYLTGLDRFGNFYYVEEKLYWEPPSLPTPPQKRIRSRPGLISSVSTWFILYGVVGVVAGLVAMATEGNPGWIACQGMIIVGGVLVGLLGLLLRPRDERIRRGLLAQYEDTVNFDRAIEEWVNKIKAADLESRTNDEFGRFYLAVRSTIRQTIQTLFIDRHAELRERKEKELSQQELGAELEKRKAQGFQ